MPGGIYDEKVFDEPTQFRAKERREPTPLELHASVLMNRLWKACQRFPDLGYEKALWANGLDVIQRKYGVRIWLSSFRPAGVEIVTTPESVVTLTITNDGPQPDWAV